MFIIVKLSFNEKDFAKMIISFDKASTLDTAKRVAYIEPYYGGSHKSLIDILRHHYGGDLFAMRAKKWHW